MLWHFFIFILDEVNQSAYWWVIFNIFKDAVNHMVVNGIWAVFIEDLLDLLAIVVDELMLGEPVSFEPNATAYLG